jgi:integrase
VEEEPEIYSKAELKSFFAACDSEERLWSEFFLMTGERKREVMYTYWSDIRFAQSCPGYPQTRSWLEPKTYKEREIPVPVKLLKVLKPWKAKSEQTCNLVFPTAGSNPKLGFSRLL